MSDLISNSSRRKDTSLRIAVDRIYNKFRNAESANELIELATELLCDLTDSSTVVSFSLEFNENRRPYFKNIHKIEKNNNETHVRQDVADIPIDNEIKTLYKNCIANSPAVFNDKKIIELFVADDNASSPILIMPVQANQKTVAIFALYGAPTPYHIQQTRRFAPLFNALSHTCRVLKNKQECEDVSLEDVLDYKHNIATLETISPSPMLILDSKFKIIRANPALHLLLGYEIGELCDQDVVNIIPDKINKFNNLFFYENKKDSARDCKKNLLAITREGLEVTLSTITFNIRENGQQHILIFVFDHSANELIQNRYELELARFKALSELAPIGILQTDEKWHTCYVNSQWLKILGVEKKEVDNLFWTHLFNPEEAEQILSDLYASLHAHQSFKYIGHIYTQSEEKLWIQFEAQPLFDVQGNLSGFIATISDNTDHHNTAAKLRNIAETDPLTKLPNRLALMSRLETSLKRVERRGAMAMLSLDLDGFKNVNDTLGHGAGDQLLILVATRITKVLREEDFFARLGGDEFIILLEQISDAQIASSVAHKVLAELNRPFKIENEEIFISSSIGVCFAVAGHKCSSTLLMKQADLAMYHAKEMGRNTIEYYSPSLDKSSREKLIMGNNLHKAIGQDEFEVFYQLQLNIHNNQILGLEALMRWRKADNTLVTPDHFIPFLEENGLIIPVSRRVIKKALKQLRYWIDEGVLDSKVVMAINLSPKQFRDPVLLKHIMQCLKDNDLNGENLTLEITETMLLQDSKEVNEILEKFSNNGIKISLDDFGTGYSSLSHIKKYPISEIKIDRSFISNLLTDTYDHEIAKAIIALAHSLKINVVAEGIETNEIRDELKRLNCISGQGYLFNRPLPAAELSTLLVEYKRNSTK
ncbi:bifunctional diguanylate cyclase/phosphodiesterase [uncultured Paraglaciecola sp.]|uniref:sensor domain-containing protein n=1 Tax=uncultured Paraglaciecola sp. TaxID=1765024 RepID=UPI002638109F|nr:bifunctional diguanylate cyclase/phosphodiesterase [uncultured Paraglaciecola sp.]